MSANKELRDVAQYYQQTNAEAAGQAAPVPAAEERAAESQSLASQMDEAPVAVKLETPNGLTAYDAAEQSRPELARGAKGELKSTFEDARDRYRTGFALRPEDHIRRLREDSSRASTPELAERYAIQANFEESRQALMVSPKLLHANAEARELMLKEHQRGHQADLAKLDLRSGTEHAATAVARLDEHAIEPRAVWAKETYKSSELRSALPAAETVRYDAYRDAIAGRLAARDGVPAEGYVMSKSDADVFDRVYARFDEKLKLEAAQSASQRAQSKQVSGGDVNGLVNQPGEAAKVPREMTVAGYQSARAEDGRTVEYRVKGEEEVSFVDLGEKISVSVPKRTDPKALRAALTVAASKFDRLSLNGSKEFRESAAREAVSMGMGSRISNPDLKEFVQQEQERQRVQKAQEGLQQPLEATRAASASQAVGTQRGGAQASPQSQAPTASQALHASSPQQAEGRASSRGAEPALGGSAEFPVRRMSNQAAKSKALGGSEEFPVARMHPNDTAAGQSRGTDEFPVKRVSGSGWTSTETISSDQQQGGGVRIK